MFVEMLNGSGGGGGNYSIDLSTFTASGSYTQTYPKNVKYFSIWCNNSRYDSATANGDGTITRGDSDATLIQGINGGTVSLNLNWSRQYYCTAILED